MAELQSVESALEALLKDVKAGDVERIDCEAAAGRVLAESVTARLDVPPADNSAMDGYALRQADAGQWLPISQRIAAGHAPDSLAPGTCARIFTGGEIPPGADTVIMQERVEAQDAQAYIPGDITLGDNVRRRGRDVRADTPLLEAGTRLEAAALGHLAGQGITQVGVYRRPRVALLSTGDEIIEPGQSLAPGQIHNSNRPMLSRLLERFGAELVMRKHVADDFATTQRLLREASERADVIVTTGGVSVGEEDHVKHALESLGQLDLWQLAMRPGKPLALGRIGQARLVGLPGNPVSCFVGAWVYLRPLMGALLGCPRMATLPRLWASAAFTTHTQARRHYMRVGLEFTVEGIVAHAFADQNSAVLSSCLEADALAVIPEHTTLHEGERVECLWLTD
ncbi:molybdopterin molybdotransferase MoeA [Chromohalobacter canadensis]|uniref:molybdopterin molybdotransferase MoeA n=1 Tax=Chromohalobacter canadensis TaxID=141389 RepID=UPI0021C24F99|nr:gephyrin-like molybdotransferase Glp [Chromohalobacter canadensis]MCT8469746.1 molybdopterin molybdotransferase MoeA [Chromohalobacter canadensis]MCT8472419.1 molybdopterin molybdotransferase MoeA [Chromohalobacter canadensis]MCT8499468.1 molybdopterin molybdotransferase MoeA [Chromohalobacter canadensis]